jgi:multidrug efflux pump subunit AcrA (membrane-fusion protein)
MEIRLPGEVSGSRDAMLGAPAGGFVERVLVESGAPVTQGQALAYINSGMFTAQVEVAAAQASLAKAVTSTAPHSTRPALGSTSRLTSRSSVLLPEPDGPITTEIAPPGSCRSTPCSAGCAAPG